MDICSCQHWRSVLPLIFTLLLALLIGCTQVVSANIYLYDDIQKAERPSFRLRNFIDGPCIKDLDNDTQKIDHYLRGEFAKLGWDVDEKFSQNVANSIVLSPSHSTKDGTTIHICYVKGRVEIGFYAVARREFPPEFVSTYRSLVSQLRTDYGNVLEYDKQTSRGQQLFEATQ